MKLKKINSEDLQEVVGGNIGSAIGACVSGSVESLFSGNLKKAAMNCIYSAAKDTANSYRRSKKKKGKRKKHK